MRTILFLIAMLPAFSGCGPTKSTSTTVTAANSCQHDHFYETSVQIEKHPLTINDKTNTVNEVMYHCAPSFLDSKEAMYQQFGLWQTELFEKDNPHPLLVWNDVQILPQHEARFTVIATGKASPEKTYASVIVLDENGQDAITVDSGYKNLLLQHIGYLLHEKKDGDQFHQLYLKKFSPKKWEKLYGNNS